MNIASSNWPFTLPISQQPDPILSPYSTTGSHTDMLLNQRHCLVKCMNWNCWNKVLMLLGVTLELSQDYRFMISPFRIWELF